MTTGCAEDGAGAAVSTRIAPFARPLIDEAVPAALPSPDVLWGRSHHTSVRFELAQGKAGFAARRSTVHDALHVTVYIYSSLSKKT